MKYIVYIPLNPNQLRLTNLGWKKQKQSILSHNQSSTTRSCDPANQEHQFEKDTEVLCWKLT